MCFVTWPRVFWPERREVLERFLRLSRITLEGARTHVAVALTGATTNPFIAAEAARVVRAEIVSGQNRTKLRRLRSPSSFNAS
jgi:hypothetical protein